MIFHIITVLIVIILYIMTVMLLKKWKFNWYFFVFIVSILHIFGWFLSNIIYEVYPYPLLLFGSDVYNILLNSNIFLYFLHHIFGKDIVNSTYFYEHFPLSKYHFNSFYDNIRAPLYFFLFHLFSIFIFIMGYFIFLTLRKYMKGKR